MDLQPEDFRKAKLALEEAVREADIAVQACVPSLEELEKIRIAFDSRLGRVAKMIEGCPADPVRPRNPNDN